MLAIGQWLVSRRLDYFCGMIPELRSRGGMDVEVTADTVVMEDVVDTFVRVGVSGVELAHLEVLRRVGEDLGRYSLTGEGVFIRRGLKGLRELEGLLEHQLLVSRMLKGRCLRVQKEVDRSWVSGIDPVAGR